MHLFGLFLLPSVAGLALRGPGTDLKKQQGILVTTPSNSDFDFVGCFMKSMSQILQARDNWGTPFIMENPTIKTCVAYCDNLDFDFAGIGGGK